MAVRKHLGSSFPSVLAAAKDGDGNSFERLYRAYAGPVLAFARGRGAEDAESVAQDVMLKVFQNLGGFSGDEASFESWLFSIARNRLIDGYRTSQRRPLIADGHETPQGRAPSADGRAIENSEMARLMVRLSALTNEQREVIVLRMVADLSLAQVAEIVGRPVTAVKALQKRGLRQLQKQILSEVVS